MPINFAAAFTTGTPLSGAAVSAEWDLGIDWQHGNIVAADVDDDVVDDSVIYPLEARGWPVSGSIGQVQDLYGEAVVDDYFDPRFQRDRASHYPRIMAAVDERNPLAGLCSHLTLDHDSQVQITACWGASERHDPLDANHPAYAGAFVLCVRDRSDRSTTVYPNTRRELHTTTGLSVRHVYTTFETFLADDLVAGEYDVFLAFERADADDDTVQVVVDSRKSWVIDVDKL